MKILIVDDDVTLTVILRDYLTEQGHEVSVAFDGVQGLIRCIEQSFDLVILDIFMPEMDGIELMREIRRRRLGMRVIVISGMYDAEDWSFPTVEDLGAEAILEKPLSFRRIKELVQGPGAALS